MNNLAKLSACIFSIFFLLVINVTDSYSQTGLGSQLSLNQPGLLKSENNTHFNIGSGYGFFVRHDINDSNLVNIDLRYNAVIAKHRAELLLGEKAKYNFSYFSLEPLIAFNNTANSYFYTGLGIGLVSLVSKDRFRKTYTDQIIVPIILGGWAYKWTDGFELFAEVKIIYGNSKAGPEEIPITGYKLNIGLTMYITE